MKLTKSQLYSELYNELNFLSLKEIMNFYSPEEFNMLIMNELYTDELLSVLICLLEEFIEIEAYEFCIAIRNFLDKNEITLEYN